VAGRLLYADVPQLPETATLTVDLEGLDSYQGALAWMDAGRHNLVQSILHAARHGPRYMAWLLADGISDRGATPYRAFGAQANSGCSSDARGS
jgi:hypothetical protein